MDWEEEKVLANIRRADTTDLLDRITAYRFGMELDAIEMIEAELHRRGVTTDQIDEHLQACERSCIYLSDGTAAMCSFCHRPAVAEGRTWWKIWWLIPILPRRVRYCEGHRPQ